MACPSQIFNFLLDKLCPQSGQTGYLAISYMSPRMVRITRTVKPNNVFFRPKSSIVIEKNAKET